MSDFVRSHSSVCNFSGSDSWVILSEIEQSIKNKIEAIGTPLKDWDIQINYGIKTGFNDAFIISTEKRDEILANCKTEEERQRTADLIRPILRGRDIKRYGYDWANLWLIATFPAKHYDIEKYPAVKQYLLSIGIEKLEQTGKTHIVHGETIKARKKTNNKWFETQDSISYWDDFFKPKIMYAEIVQEPRFYLDNEGYFFPEATTFILTGEHLKYLYNLFNSSVISYLFKTFYAGGGLGENGYRYKKAFFENLPIPKYKDTKLQKQIVLADECADIAKNVFELFGFSNDEISYIENREL